MDGWREGGREGGRGGTYVIASGAVFEDKALELVFLKGSVQVVEEGDVLREGGREGGRVRTTIDTSEGGREGGGEGGREGGREDSTLIQA